MSQGDGALLYKRQKARCAMSQAELVFQILREGVQSAHSQVNAPRSCAMVWSEEGRCAVFVRASPRGCVR